MSYELLLALLFINHIDTTSIYTHIYIYIYTYIYSGYLRNVTTLLLMDQEAIDMRLIPWTHGDYYHYMLALTDKHVGDEPSIGGPLAMLIDS